MGDPIPWLLLELHDCINIDLTCDQLFSDMVMTFDSNDALNDYIKAEDYDRADPMQGYCHTAYVVPLLAVDLLRLLTVNV